MINIGHSPILLKNILLWLWHEANLSRDDTERLLENKSETTCKLGMYSWISDPNKAQWLVWQECVEGLSEILDDYGMDIHNFDVGDTYTPDNLTKLRERSGLGLDEFSELVNIPAKDLLVFESCSSINTKGISYQKYVGLLEIVELELAG